MKTVEELNNELKELRSLCEHASLQQVKEIRKRIREIEDELYEIYEFNEENNLLYVN